MPRPRIPLPELPQVFSVGEALSSGASPDSLRHPSLYAPYHGVRVLDAARTDEQDLRGRVLEAARHFSPRLRPGECVSHVTALILHRCPIHTRPSLEVTAPPGIARNRTRGVIGHEASAALTTVMIAGIPVAAPLVALEQGAARLSLLELVVAIDHLVLSRGFSNRPIVSAAAVLDLAARYRGRGARRLRQAAAISRTGAESRMETLTRLLLLAFGLEHCFELQVDLHDDEGWIGRFDLVDRERRVIVEFDGEQHRTNTAQYRKDLRRLDRVRDAGYIVIRLLAEDVIDRPRATAIHIAAKLGVEIREHALLSELLARPQKAATRRNSGFGEYRNPDLRRVDRNERRAVDQA